MTYTPYIVALGIQELDRDALLALRDMVPEGTLQCCASESDWREALLRRRPDALLIFQVLSPDVQHTLGLLLEAPGARAVPVFLCGQASPLIFHLPMPFSVYRTASGLPEQAMLRKVLDLPPKPALWARDAEQTRRAPAGPEDAGSLPRFLGGITHDFNNLLAIIMGEVQLAASRSREPVVSAHLERANDACFRMAGEIRKLLVFQESNHEKRGMVDLRQVLRDAGRFVPEGLGSGASVEVGESREPLWVEATYSGLRQIILNLALYVHRRVPQGTVKLGARVDTRSGMPGQVVMEVSARQVENGHGLPVEAFQSMRTSSMRDAGVGLAIVWELVEDLGGSVNVLHEHQGGVWFRVSLPLAHPSALDASGQLNALRGAEHLLVISTERPSAESFARDVRSLGYGVQVLSNLDALPSLFHDSPMRADAVLLDASCEGIDAVAAHGALRAMAPRLPILMAAHDMSALHRPPFSGDPLTCLVHKPVDIREVLTSVRAMIGGGRMFGTDDFAASDGAGALDNSRQGLL